MPSDSTFQTNLHESNEMLESEETEIISDIQSMVASEYNIERCLLDA